eukprot:COSAG06_NODE_205_length_20281_cov_6.904448_1_plen_106_part_00
MFAADLDIAYGKFCLARLGWGAKEFRERVQREEEDEDEDEDEEGGASVDNPAGEAISPPAIGDADESAEDSETMFEACGCAVMRQLEPVCSFDDARVVFKSANPR